MIVKEIYQEALLKIDPVNVLRFVDKGEDAMRAALVAHSMAKRQSYEARVARIALKNAAYARINGGS